jgi:hypothetical protein
LPHNVYSAHPSRLTGQAWGARVGLWRHSGKEEGAAKLPPPKALPTAVPDPQGRAGGRGELSAKFTRS